VWTVIANRLNLDGDEQKFDTKKQLPQRPRSRRLVERHMMYVFAAEMHVTFKDADSPSVFDVLVVADHASSVIEKGPAQMLARYNNQGWMVEKVEFFGVQQREHLELIIP
jgi:hypothetical protein